MTAFTQRADVMIFDLILTLKVIHTVLLMNFISAAVILLVSDLFRAHTSYLQIIISTTKQLYIFNLVSLLLLRALFLIGYHFKVNEWALKVCRQVFLFFSLSKQLLVFIFVKMISRTWKLNLIAMQFWRT